MSRILASSLLALSVAASGFAVGCGGNPHGPVLPSAHPVTGVADDDTWVTLQSHGARLKAPPGWKYRSDDVGLTASAPDGRAALVLGGATTRGELETKVRALGVRYGLDHVEFGGFRPVELNGIKAVIFEDMSAEATGDPGDVLVMFGEAPNGKGIVYVFLWATDRTQMHDLNLIAAANTLRPI